jgi:hypothetical protein
LRVYMDNTSTTDNELITYAELMSECICEECGGRGITYTMGWHKTLCVQHAVARYGEKAVIEYKNNE